MPVSAAYKSFIQDLLADFGPVSIRRMFSGAGVYTDGVMFAILADVTLYLKADEVSARDFAAEGKGPFTYRPKGRGPVALSYWEVPERLLDDPEELVTWARRAHAIALAAKAEKRRLYCAFDDRLDSCGPNTKIGMSGCPETMPSASDSARSSIG
jgi:DNA transformation protein